MANILLVTGHTHPELSIANKKVIELLQKEFPNIVTDNLIELYPDYKIDIEAEKAKILKADIIVIQAPLFWYSLPSIVMRWIEEVFQHGWAYGSQGHALDNKKIVVGLTVGGNDEFYETDRGDKGVTSKDVIKLIRIDFVYCNMNYLGQVFTTNCLYTGKQEDIQRIHANAEGHAKKLIELIKKNI